MERAAAFAIAAASVTFVGREGLALLDADGGHHALGLRAEVVVGLLLDQVVQLLEEGVVVGQDGVHLLARDVDELHPRRVGDLGQRVDLQVVADVVRGGLDPVVDVAAREHPHAIGLRRDHEVALRHVALVAWRQHQELAALALVRAGHAQVRHVAEGHVVEYAKHPGREIDDRRTVLLEIEEAHRIHRRRIPREQQAGGIHQRVPDGDLVARIGADARLPCA